MPTVVTLRLLPAVPGPPDTRQLHGLACALFETDVDHRAQRKPFTIWPATPDPLDPQAGLLLRASWLPDTPLPFDPDELTKVRLGSRLCPVLSADHTTRTRARLAAGPALHRAELRFRSPVYFAANNRRTIAPDLRLILRGYRDRWNEHLPDDSPLRIDDDLARTLHRTVELVSYELSTTRHDGGHGHLVTGFTGRMTLAPAPGTPPDHQTTLTALLRFAPYSGTGARTTHGFGATALHEPPTRP
ncbi:CRISPR system precrRNA processing endoribonuclease RAMP protein Cas6 [Thermomonospora cellulosilytica]|uniref:CRISPR-associated endoribonuclease Cas6 n=1 Tax=Thermomonospora cellulosilytica TaxID=1411118 RepID=A0A7W3N498_9ACTN|nr:CRISPR system precrRNA processing endoribonuclease RAMP protein Cas6 [Thermomonospora cellulosilytica]MBA9007286.1 CRISPR-associated endoribonuclease Cas6 [Thermomonospora cellulosilytica]